MLSIQQSVIPLLEERLKSRCEQLLHFFSSPPNAEPGPTVGAKAGATSGVSLLTAKAWQLPKLLSDATAQPQVAVSQAVEAERRTELAHFQQFQVRPGFIFRMPRHHRHALIADCHTLLVLFDSRCATRSSRA